MSRKKAAKRKSLSARLIMANSVFAGLVIVLRKRRTIIGRSLSSDICLVNVRVAENHAEIIRTEKVCTIRDLGNHGVKVNGQTILEAVLLRRGDIIKIGTFKLKFLR